MCGAILNQATTLFGNMDIYLYGNPDRAFGEFNLEQQASIVDEWFGANGTMQTGNRQESEDSPYSATSETTLGTASYKAYFL